MNEGSDVSLLFFSTRRTNLRGSVAVNLVRPTCLEFSSTCEGAGSLTGPEAVPLATVIGVGPQHLAAGDRLRSSSQPDLVLGTLELTALPDPSGRGDERVVTSTQADEALG